MPTFQVSATCPPPLFYGCDYYERSSDPFHPDALNPALAQAGFAPIETGVNKRRLGWMMIDYAENPVGFVPDGELTINYEPKPEDMTWDIHKEGGPFGTITAYPARPEWASLIENHKKQREQAKCQ